MIDALLKHEDEAAAVIARQPRVLLFDTMGVGKTVSVLEGLKRASGSVLEPLKCIVCAPNTIIGQWADEISKWLHPYGFVCVIALGDKTQRELKYNYFESVDSNVVLLTNYSFILKDSFFKECSSGVLILDEGYLIRNKHTKVHQFLKSYIQSFSKVVILSGNAESFTVQQFYDIVDLMFPGEIKKGSKQEMQAALGERYLSRDFKDIDETVKFDGEPEVDFIGQDLNDEQKKLLSEIAIEENRAMKSPDSYNARHFYQKRLAVLHSPRILDNSFGYSPKEEFMLDKLKTSDVKCVVYCPDVKFFKLLKSDLNGAGVKFMHLSGDMSSDVRNRNVNLFKNDPTVRCLLLSGVGKFGLNLQVANLLICMSVPKGQFDLGQIVGRLNRIDQQEKVICYIPYHFDSLEAERVKKLTKISE